MLVRVAARCGVFRLEMLARIIGAGYLSKQEYAVMQFSNAVEILLGEIQGEAIEVSDLAEAKATVRSALDTANMSIINDIANGMKVTGVSDPTDGTCEIYQDAAIEQARRQYGSEGAIEVDDGAQLSKGDDPGTYVQAWLWVYDQDVGVQPYPGDVDLSFSLHTDDVLALEADGGNLPGDCQEFIVTPGAVYHENEESDCKLAERAAEGFNISVGDHVASVLVEWPGADCCRYEWYTGRFERQKGRPVAIALCGDGDVVVKSVTFEGAADLKNEGIYNGAGDLLIAATWGDGGGFRYGQHAGVKLIVRPAEDGSDA